MKKNATRRIAFWVLLITLFNTAQAQFISIGPNPSNVINTVITGAPVLSINTNPQSMGSGGVGVVASELNLQNGLDQNPALLSSKENIVGFQLLNYTSYLRSITTHPRLLESSFYRSFKRHAFGSSSRYLILPEVLFTDIVGNTVSTFIPNEFFINVNYAYEISENFSLGAGVKYIRSNLTNATTIQGTPSNIPTVFAGDFGLSYRKIFKESDKFSLKWNAGLSILNIGSKLRYTETSNGFFLPQTLKLGSLITLYWKKADNDNIALDFSYQANKLLVPTPPIYTIGTNGTPVIAEGLDPNVNPFRGLVQSFYDAPDGLREELREIIHQFGSEARFSLAENKVLIAFRAGYFNEHALKGNRKFITAGLGVGVYGFRLDFARLFPTQQNHPLTGTFYLGIGGRFSLNEGSYLKFIE